MDERESLERVNQAGERVGEVIHSRGWKEVIKPALLDRELSLIGEFTGAQTYEEFVRIQQAVSAIRNLLSFIEVTLMQGELARNELRGKGDPQGA